MIQEATSLGKKLTDLAATLTLHGAQAPFNSLGEVQGRGSEIDRLCGELRLAIYLLEREGK